MTLKQQGTQLDVVNTTGFHSSHTAALFGFCGSQVALHLVSNSQVEKANLKYSQMPLALQKCAQFVVTQRTELCVFECILPA